MQSELWKQGFLHGLADKESQVRDYSSAVLRFLAVYFALNGEEAEVRMWQREFCWGKMVMRL